MKPANFAPVYAACLYTGLAEIVRSHGYALAAHGSFARDCDLICIPWIEEPSKPEEVIEDITTKYAIKFEGGMTNKLHGRKAYTLHIGFGECRIDLSFMPCVEKKGVFKIIEGLNPVTSDDLEEYEREMTRKIDGVS